MSTHTGSGVEIGPGCWLRDVNKEEKRGERERRYKEIDDVGRQRGVRHEV